MRQATLVFCAALLSIGLQAGCGSGDSGGDDDALGVDAVFDVAADVSGSDGGAEAGNLDDGLAGDDPQTLDADDTDPGSLDDDLADGDADALDADDVDAGPCGMDCSLVATARCLVAVCNTGQRVGPLNTCIVINAPRGTPCDDGLFCTAEDTCDEGTCVGGPTTHCGLMPTDCLAVGCDEEQKSCAFIPVNEGNSCTSADLCQIAPVCQSGDCVGTPRDCVGASWMDCRIVACDPVTGQCLSRPGSETTGLPCNDHDACTRDDACGGGACSGSPVAGCSVYLQEGFETCPHGWTFGGDWQCGVPTGAGPSLAHSGANVLGTQLAGPYSNDQGFDTAVADSPAIDLTQATHPTLLFWAWQQTEGGSLDGWNVEVSTNGGASFQAVTTVYPPYDGTIAGQPAWGGDAAAAGWSPWTADLSAYAGHSIVLRFAFHSDGANVFPGVYVDDVVVAEPPQVPLTITTPARLPDGIEHASYTAALDRLGGSAGIVWSIAPGAVNASWLSIDAATGTLAGVPAPSNVGPVLVTVHVEEPMLPSNFTEKTFTFDVASVLYYDGFEGACPTGWTLTGDWQCGLPGNVGPAGAFNGTQCIGTQIAGNHSSLQTWVGTTATSPDISLSGATHPSLTFRMWVDTEGSTYDGADLQISSDGGAIFKVVETVTPAYPLTIDGNPAWGGHQAALGWQIVQVDLSAYADQTIRLRFAFRSDSSGSFPGIYIDEVMVR
jgi:hypothetical protein